MGESGTRRDLRRRARTALVASLTVLATIGAVACGGGGWPGGGPPTTTVPDAPPTTLYGTPPLPDQLVAVGEDGMLAVVDRTTGERLVELAHGAYVGGGRRPIGRVRVSPEGDTAWFDTRRGRIDQGKIYRVPTDGSADPVEVGSGAFPDVSPSGSQLAFARTGMVVVQGIVTDEELSWPEPAQITDLAWTTDGTGLLWVRNRTELVWLDIADDAEPQVVAAAGAGEVLSVPLGDLRNGRAATVLVSRGEYDRTAERMVVRLGSEPTRSADPLGAALDRSYDSEGRWGIRVTSRRTIRWSGSGGIGTVATGYISADW